MAYIAIGKIVNTFGLKGEVKIESWSDFDQKRYQKGNTVYIQKDGEYLPFRVLTYRMHKGFPLVSFADHADINRIEMYKGCEVYVSEEDRGELPEGEYYRDELTGMLCADEDGNVIGKAVSVEETQGANNFLRIEREEGQDVLVPFVPAFIRNVDREQKKITIRVIGGLL